MRALRLLALLPLLGAAASDQGQTLEQLLARYRDASKAMLGRLEGDVDARLAEMEIAIRAADWPRVADTRNALRRMGAPCVPLLVEVLEPGPKADDPLKRRSLEVATVLAELPTSAATERLLELARGGSFEARRNALRVLAHTTEVERVTPELHTLFANTTGPLQEAALNAIATLGGPANERFLEEVLGSKQREVVRFALAALARSGQARVAPKVLELVRRSDDALPLVDEIVAWYRACPQAAGEEHVEALLLLARAGRGEAAPAVSLLTLLSELREAWPSGFRRKLESFADSSNRDISEAALVALTLDGDRQARKDLLAPYDRRVEGSGRWAQAWRDRGDVLYRIEDYRAAIKDYTEALTRARQEAGSMSDVYVQLARCYALTKKLRDAHDWLSRAPISYKALAELADDPAFAELREHSRYGKIFEPK